MTVALRLAFAIALLPAPHKAFDIGATYAAVEPSAQTPSDDLLLVEVGIEGRHALGLEISGHPLDWGAYLLGEAFGDRPEEPLDQAAPNADRFQYEIGITFGTRAPATLWRIPIPRAGLAYRFGDDLGVWRVVIGAPF